MALAWFNAYAFLCPVCLTENPETFCACCGRNLTAADLYPYTNQDSEGSPAKKRPTSPRRTETR